MRFIYWIEARWAIFMDWLDKGGAMELPDDLQKAIYDKPFDYALGLKDGTILFFSGASFRRGSLWIHIQPHPDMASSWREDVVDGKLLEIPFDRGVDVRISEIVWVADAPFGS